MLESLSQSGENLLWQAESVLFVYDYLLLNYWYSYTYLLNFELVQCRKTNCRKINCWINSIDRKKQIISSVLLKSKVKIKENVKARNQREIWSFSSFYFKCNYVSKNFKFSFVKSIKFIDFFFIIKVKKKYWNVIR